MTACSDWRWIAVLPWVLGTLGCGSGGGTPPGGATGPRGSLSFPEVLSAWDESAGVVVDQLTYLAQDARDLRDALEGGDDASIDLAAELFATDVDMLLPAIEELDVLEDEIVIRGGSDGSERVGVAQAPLIGVISVGVTLYGLYKLGRFFKRKSDLLTKQRKARDEAATGVTEGQPGAEEAYRDAKDSMQKTGEEVIVELSTKVTTEIVLSPASPKTLLGIILKDKAGNRVQEGLKVLTGTEGCATETADGGVPADCRLSAGRTDAAGKVAVPAGPLHVAVSGEGMARAVKDGVTVVEGGETTLEIPPVPIETATPDQVELAEEGRTPATPHDASGGAAEDAHGDGGQGSTGGTVQGTWPETPHGGMTLSYTIEGLDLGPAEPRVSADGLEVKLHYPIVAVASAVHARVTCAWSGSPGPSTHEGAALVWFDDADHEPVTHKDAGSAEPDAATWTHTFEAAATLPADASALQVEVLLLCDDGGFVGQGRVISVQATTF